MFEQLSAAFQDEETGHGNMGQLVQAHAFHVEGISDFQIACVRTSHNINWDKPLTFSQLGTVKICA